MVITNFHSYFRSFPNPMQCNVMVGLEQALLHGGGGRGGSVPSNPDGRWEYPPIISEKFILFLFRFIF